MSAREQADLLRVLKVAHANLDGNPDYPQRSRTDVTARTYTYISPEARTSAIERAARGETYSAIGRSMGLSHSTIRRAVLGIQQKAQT